jgi:peptidoglycan/xylan/chitin deacetylase (PgdA/CDA1 family)
LAGAAGGALIGHEAAAASVSEREGAAYAHTQRGRSNLIWSVATTELAVAVTFDDGPTADLTADVVDLLATRAIPATFFVIGELVEQRPAVVRKMLASGHEVGNHSYDHSSAATSSASETERSIERGRAVIERVTGRSPAWYRPPKGHVTGAVLATTARTGQSIAMWSLTRGTSPDRDERSVRRHLIDGIHPGAVVDLHDGVGESGINGPLGYDGEDLRRRRAEIAALPDVLDAWRAAGYRFLTLSDLVALDEPPEAPST